MTKQKTKSVTMQVTVTCPTWLPPHEARQEVRSLINDQCFHGYTGRPGGVLVEINAANFRARSVTAMPRSQRPAAVSDPAMAHPLPLDTMMLYRRLADGISDMLEDGRISAVSAPEDHAWLTNLIDLIEREDPGDQATIDSIRQMFGTGPAE